MQATIIHIHEHRFDDQTVRALLASIRNLADSYQSLRQHQEAIMSKLDDIISKSNQVLAQVRAETEVDEAIKLVVDHQNSALAALSQQLKDALDNNDPAKLNELADALDQIQQTNMANAQKVADAVKAGTPAADTGSGSQAGSSDAGTPAVGQTPQPSQDAPPVVPPPNQFPG